MARFFGGTDKEAVQGLQQQIEQNQIQIQQLTELQNQLSNQEDITAVAATIQALTQQNTTLQERINTEERSRGIFGWLFGIFGN